MNVEERGASINKVIHNSIPELAEIHIPPSHNHRSLVQQPLRRQFIPKRSHEGQLILLQAMESPSIEEPDEMQTDTERPAPNFKDLISGREGGGVGQELKHIPATGPWLAVVTVVLLDEELPGARQCGVVGRLFFRIMRDPMVPVEVEELPLAGAGIDALAEFVPGVAGGEEGEGVGGELRLEPGDVVGGGGDGGRGGSGGGGGDAGGGVGGDGVGAGAEVGPGGGGGGREEEEDEERGGGEQEEQCRHGEQPRRGAAARRERHR